MRRHAALVNQLLTCLPSASLEPPRQIRHSGFDLIVTSTSTKTGWLRSFVNSGFILLDTLYLVYISLTSIKQIFQKVSFSCFNQTMRGIQVSFNSVLALVFMPGHMLHSLFKKVNANFKKIQSLMKQET